MELSQQDLRQLGQTVAGTFKKVVESQWSNNSDVVIPSKRRIAAEEERFRLWARTLGLFQTGHASLDYRVRDASFVKASLKNLVAELQDHLQNLLDIALGTRLPLEQDEQACEKHDEATSDDDDESLESSLSSAGSFKEADFRFSSIVSRLDSLYKLASRIRSPQNRPQRPIADLCKHIPESQRAEYIHNQQQIETSLISHVQRQHLWEAFSDEKLEELGLDQGELTAQYASPTHWLITRVGRANARRKQQFLYWKKHAQILGRSVAEEPPAAPEVSIDMASPSRMGLQSQAAPSIPVQSMITGTSATRLDHNMMDPSDKKSVISTRSRTSTVVNNLGEKLAWPPPPTHPAGTKYFPCPYCGILCPDRYLRQDEWRAHQIHDLQPYLCTYQDCSDPSRLYGSKQEWIDHEGQHRRVWHCLKHEAEFETLPEYLGHLKAQHPDTEAEECTAEMTAVVVGPSRNPHRDCPLCPTTFSDVAHMQKHVRYHLERLALYVLPDMEDGAVDELALESPSDSHQVIENRGRQDSIGKDFEENLDAFLADFKRGPTLLQEVPPYNGFRLTKGSLIHNQAFSSTPWIASYLDRQQDQNWAPVDQVEWPAEFLGETRGTTTEPKEEPPQIDPANLGGVASELSSDSYQVAWICTSSGAELSAAKTILDDHQETLRLVIKGGVALVRLGKVGPHHVVVCSFLETKRGATYSPAHLLDRFPNLRFGLVVGIGSGKPNLQHDVRLGDIVVDGSDMPTSGGQAGPPHPVYQSAVRMLTELQGNPSQPRMQLGARIMSKLHAWESQHGNLYSRPHDSDFQDSRPARTWVFGQQYDGSAIHYVGIDSSGLHIADAELRDYLAVKSDAIYSRSDALDLADFPCMSVIGIRNYGDSHKNDEWRDHAAMMAALYAKDLLSAIPAEAIDGMEPISRQPSGGPVFRDTERHTDRQKYFTHPSSMMINEARGMMPEFDDDIHVSCVRTALDSHTYLAMELEGE